jgi:hypothetical protein
MSLAAKLKTAKALADRLPPPPLTSRWWLAAFERCGGGEMGLAEREPDFARLLAAYRRVYAVPGAESAALHEWLAELYLRAHRGAAACGEAEFRELAAWFRGGGHAREVAARGWARAALPGGRSVSLWDLREGVERGPGRAGSGSVAELLRELRGQAEPSGGEA